MAESKMVDFDANYFQDKLASLGIKHGRVAAELKITGWTFSNYLRTAKIPLEKLNDMNDYIYHVEQKIKEDPNMSITPYKRRTLTKDISISELKQLRSEGLTYNQIAKRLDVSENTVWRYLHKEGMTQNDEPKKDSSPKIKVEIPYRPKEQIMDIPYNNPVPPVFEYNKDTKDTIATHIKSTKRAVDELAKKLNSCSTLKLTEEIIKWKFEGVLCNYKVNKTTGEIEMVEGAISGLLDRNTISKFIAELEELEQKLA